jgi:hypothetical protein
MGVVQLSFLSWGNVESDVTSRARNSEFEERGHM